MPDVQILSTQDYEDGKIISSLTIRNVTAGDFGQYSCHAENTEGEGAVQIILERQTVSSSSNAFKLSSLTFYILINTFLVIS